MAMVAEALTISALSTLTGLDRRTLGKRLRGLEPLRKDGRAAYYESAQALEQIYLGTGGEKKRDPAQERARKDAMMADRYEMDLAARRRELIEKSEILAVYGDMYAATRAKIVQLPSTLAARGAGLEARELRSVAEELVFAALKEIQDIDPATLGLSGDRGSDSPDDGPALEADG